MCARHTPISHRSLSASAFLLVINTGLAFGQEPLFPGRQFKKDAYSPSVVITEVNGDAKKDIVMVNSITHDISVLMGSGDGGFGVAMNYSVSPGINPYSLAMGDFNGDGKADVATGNWNSQDISILLNAGTGSFGAPGNFSIGKVPVSIAIGDANGDGNLDIATADYYSNTASILLGSGTGTLGAASHFNVGTSPLGGLAFGDLSGDGNADLVTTNLNSNDISILLGDGLGSFAAANNISVGTNPYSIEIGDFDGDGNRDLIITIRYPGAVVLLMGTGAGAFAPPNYLSAGLTVPMDLAIADIDGDSRLDLLISESTNLSVLLGNGLGAFASPSIHEIGNFAESIVLDDINSDGRIDLAAWSMGYRSVTVLLGKAFDSISGPFITVKRFVTGGFPKHAAIVDMNADGNPDVVTENSGGNNIYLLLGDGAGSLGASSNIHVGFTPGAFTVGDLNADGNPDLITANTTAKNISVLLATSSGGAVSFPSFSTYAVGNHPPTVTNPVAVAVGDLNRDGVPDLVTANNNSQRGISVLLGSGAGSFTLASVSGVLPRNSIAIGDLNADGNADLVATSFLTNGIVSVMSGLGGGSFSPEVNFSVGSFPTSVEIGDLDSDGATDVVTANSDWNGSVSVLLGLGTGMLGAAANFSVGEFPGSVDICDVNGDGKPDLLTPNKSTGVGLLLGLGNGVFGPADYYSSGRRNITSAIAADLNADGAPDVLAVNPYQHSYSYISPGPADPYPYPSSISVLLNQRQQPAGNVVYGTGTAGCSGILTMRSNEAPKVNSPNFSLSCSNAPANSFGFGIVTDSPDMFGTYLFGLGIKFHVDFSAATQILTYDFISDAGGSGYSPAPIPNHSSIAGQTFYAQTLWVENAANGQACSQAPFGLVSSAGLALTIQP